MRRPELRDFGVHQEDVDWAKATEERLPMVLFVASACGWGVYGLLTATSFHPALILLALFLGFPVVFLTTLVLLFPADFLLRAIHPRYRRGQRFLKALKQFRAWWIRTQQEFWCSLSGTQFEAELAALFRRAGFRAELTSSSGDEGVDIWLYTERGRGIVQCKAHRTPVGPAVVRELYGTLQHFGAPAATLASTSGFTKGVVNYARDKPIKLLGLSEIIGLQERLSSGP
jgi:hypothetical protein